MPTKCVVPSCKTGYSGCNEKLSLFQAPKNRAAEWRQLIPRANFPASEKWFVCEVHFEPWFIERTFNFVINGQTTEMPRDRPRLLEGARPTIFPDLPTYLSKKLPKPRKEKARIITASAEKAQSPAQTPAQTPAETAELPVEEDLPTTIAPQADKQQCSSQKTFTCVCLRKQLLQSRESSYRLKRQVLQQRTKIRILQKKVTALQKEKSILEEKVSCVEDKVKRLPVPQQTLLSRCSDKAVDDERRKLTSDLDAILENPHLCQSDYGSLHMDDEYTPTSDHDYVKATDFDSTVTEDIVYYLGGYVVRKLKKITDCDNCIKSTTGSNSERTLPASAQLVIVKTRGELLHPSKKLDTLLQLIEKEIQNSLSLSGNLQHDVYLKIMQEVICNPEVPLNHVGCTQHLTSLTKFVINFYVSSRLHFFTKLVNKRRVSKKNNAKNLRKKCRLTS